MKRRATLLVTAVALLAIGFFVGRVTSSRDTNSAQLPAGAAPVEVHLLSLDAAKPSSPIAASPELVASRAPSGLIGQPDPRNEPKPPKARESDAGEIVWIGHRRDEFTLEHGIEPEPVTIRPPANEQELRDSLTGTIWGWGSSPSSDKEWVIFLEDGTVYGSWGFRYRYSVDPETMEIIWAEHRTGFSDQYRYLQTRGRHPRIGMLLKQVEGAAMEAFLQDVEGMDVILEDENAVPDGS